MLKRKSLHLLLGACVALPLLSLPAEAYSGYLDQIRMQYQHNYKCNLCHLPKGLNVFGKDFKKAHKQTKHLRRVLKVLAQWDSDKDGIQNQIELIKGSQPADPNSRPK